MEVDQRELLEGEAADLVRDVALARLGREHGPRHAGQRVTALALTRVLVPHLVLAVLLAGQRLLRVPADAATLVRPVLLPRVAVGRLLHALTPTGLVLLQVERPHAAVPELLVELCVVQLHRLCPRPRLRVCVRGVIVTVSVFLCPCVVTPSMQVMEWERKRKKRKGKKLMVITRDTSHAQDVEKAGEKGRL